MEKVISAFAKENIKHTWGLKQTVPAVKQIHGEL